MGYFGIPFRNGVPIGLGSVVSFGAQQFDPSELFAGGTAGAWYDPSDLSTMFDTSTGTTPVAMPGQGAPVPVGLMLDKSQGLVLGSELVTPAANRDFSSNTGYWTIAGSITITGGQAVYTSANSLNGIYRTGFTTAGTYYEVTFTVGSITAGALRVYAGGNRTANVTTAGTYTQRVVAGNTDTLLIFECFGTTTLTLDDVSVKVVSGNHAIAANDSTKRPVLMARVNLLTYSEEFDNGAWTRNNVTITANAATAPDGTTTADLVYPSTSGTNRYVWQQVTGLTTGATFKTLIRLKNSGINFAYVYNARGNQLFYVNLTTGATSNVGTNISNLTSSVDANGWVTVTFESVLTDAVTTAFIFVGASDAAGSTSVTASGTNGILVWGADLRPANIGANAPAYQRIADANTYDTSGFPLYLRFDGIDDSMYTPANLNLSGTDKVAVFAGVRKLSDAALAVVAEISANSGATNGTFAFFAPISAAANYGFRAHGTGLATYAGTTYTAPITNVTSCVHDIAGATIAEEIIPRVNGVTPTLTVTNAGPAGTGNFGTYPLFIGARNNASNWLNGQLYSLIIAGSAVSAGNISATEQWVAGRTGISIP